MAEEGNKGVALAILGIVAVIAVVGLVLLFTGATTGKVSMPFQKVYGGVHYGEEFPYLSDRSSGGYPSTAGEPDAVYYDQGFYTEKPAPVTVEDQMPMQGAEASGTRSRISFNRQGYYVPSGQLCAGGPSTPGFRCPQGTTCITDQREATSGNWVPAPAAPCYTRATS